MKAMSLPQFFRQFPDDAAAERYFIQSRWPNGIRCPHCASDNVQARTTHKTMPHRCRSCRRFFSVRTGMLIEDSKLGYQTWLLAAYLLHTAKKGMSSVALAEKLGICQKTAWFLAHRIREAWGGSGGLMAGTVEADETWIGGKERNRHYDRKQAIPKVPVVGAKERESNQVIAAVVPAVTRATVHDWLGRTISTAAWLYTDESPVYNGVAVSEHQTVNHKRKQYVCGDVTTNGIESFWALLKRGYKGSYHWWSPQHLQRYLTEFTGRFNARDLETRDQLRALAVGMIGRRLTYRELAAAP